MKRILIVDDDPTITTLEDKVLSREGYQVVAAADGEAAKTLLREQHFDLLLLDIMMPGVDGFDVARAFRSESKNKRVPVIFVTSRSDGAAMKEGFKAGGTFFLAKPLNSVQLKRLVNSLIAE